MTYQSGDCVVASASACVVVTSLHVRSQGTPLLSRHACTPSRAVDDELERAPRHVTNRWLCRQKEDAAHYGMSQKKNNLFELNPPFQSGLDMMLDGSGMLVPSPDGPCHRPIALGYPD